LRLPSPLAPLVTGLTAFLAPLVGVFAAFGGILFPYLAILMCNLIFLFFA